MGSSLTPTSLQINGTQTINSIVTSLGINSNSNTEVPTSKAIADLLVNLGYIKRVGGTIFYINPDSTNRYVFYDAELGETDAPNVGSDTIEYYRKIDEGSCDKFYVYNNNNVIDNGVWDYQYFGIGTEAGLGAGKRNTEKILNLGKPSNYSIYKDAWRYILDLRDTANGCNDWYIGSREEYNIFIRTGLESYFDNCNVWSSEEEYNYSEEYAYKWESGGYWLDNGKLNPAYIIPIRSF